MGIRWQPGSAGEGLKLDRIQPNSAAARSGLKVGDRLVRFDGQEVDDTQRFVQQVLAAQSPVQIAVKRGDEILEMPLELDQQPTRVGISWREDDAEPGSVLLTRVIPNSPASLAGLRLGDRIYDVCGQPFDGTEEFVQLVTTMPSPLELTVERNGQIQHISFDVPPPTTTEL
jgi:S1-C subfamily serine protease